MRPASICNKLWLAFLKDPQAGLLNYGWPIYNGSTESLVQMGLDSNVTAVIASGVAYDAGCK